MDLEALTAKVRASLSAKRLKHVVGVAQTAVDLAGRYALDEEEMERAAWVHDLFREAGPEELFERAQAYGISLTEEARRWPIVLHGPVAARWAEAQGVLRTPEGLEAVCYHMSARPDLSRMGKALFIADKIEPGRHYRGVEALRELAVKDLERCFCETLKRHAEYLVEDGFPPGEELAAAYRQYVGRRLIVGSGAGGPGGAGSRG